MENLGSEIKNFGIFTNRSSFTSLPLQLVMEWPCFFFCFEKDTPWFWSKCRVCWVWTSYSATDWSGPTGAEGINLWLLRCLNSNIQRCLWSLSASGKHGALFLLLLKFLLTRLLRNYCFSWKKSLTWIKYDASTFRPTMFFLRAEMEQDTKVYLILTPTEAVPVSITPPVGAM